MNFNQHYRLKGEHAFLGASNYHWLNYSEEKLRQTYSSSIAKQRGTALHKLAEDLIKLKVRLPKNKSTLNRYVNDAIGFDMTPELVLYYSDNCFGTADSISFERDRKTKRYVLRISDLKTGSSPTSMAQLKIYASIFCLEYGYSPNEIDIVLRIYQNDEVTEEIPDPTEILYIMDKIKRADQIIEEMKMEV